ncbi:M48 family metalloprotease [Propionivibrio sp.]|uniref:M48 family metalloprotease n=1 Tax=Propionivibrio sp. TaxID=2212460 RepID=UPI0025D831A6|nr:M48 family metalloprotease [Propionivibrio sp.]MBK7355662.1 M48 family metalloprotease [Propionivibrio sp.]MBK8745479.1 M48 family metalloprotease [Propionivibrio sp.]
MSELIYPRERTLGNITLILGLLAWLGLIVGTFGMALIGLAIGFVLYLFIQSTLIAHIKGNGVELSESQFPDLHAQFKACCERLQIAARPQAYVLNGNGGLNAFATKFLGTQYVVLMSDVVDAMDQHADGVRFYIGHELGHLRMKHLSGHLLRWPALWLPLLGAAYSRARESTCDRHGLACSSSPEGAARALSALSAGAARWKNLDVSAYLGQASHSSGFWMSFHELTAGYPWLTKRAARVMDTRAPMPRRHGLAYLLAAFIPYAGRLGGGFGLLIVIYIAGVLAAIAIPAYQDYKVRAVVNVAYVNSQNVREALVNYYETNQRVPPSLDQMGLGSKLPDGSPLSLDPNKMVLTVGTAHGELVFIPSVGANGHIVWSCTNGEGLKPTQLPPACRRSGNP